MRNNRIELNPTEEASENSNKSKEIENTRIRFYENKCKLNEFVNLFFESNQNSTSSSNSSFKQNLTDNGIINLFQQSSIDLHL